MLSSQYFTQKRTKIFTEFSPEILRLGFEILCCLLLGHPKFDHYCPYDNQIIDLPFLLNIINIINYDNIRESLYFI